jgi:hypothetical protein
MSIRSDKTSGERRERGEREREREGEREMSFVWRKLTPINKYDQPEHGSCCVGQ